MVHISAHLVTKTLNVEQLQGLTYKLFFILFEKRNLIRNYQLIILILRKTFQFVYDLCLMMFGFGNDNIDS